MLVVFIDLFGNKILELEMDKEKANAISCEYNLGNKKLAVVRRVTLRNTMHIECIILKGEEK